MSTIRNGVETPYQFEYSLKPMTSFDNSTGCHIVGTEKISKMSGVFFFSPGSLIKADMGMRQLSFPGRLFILFLFLLFYYFILFLVYLLF